MLELAKESAAKGINGPYIVLWWHHTINGNAESSKHIYDNHLKSSIEELPTGPILNEAATKADEKPLTILIDTLKASPTHRHTLGDPASCLLSILCDQKRFDDAIRILEEINSFISLDDIDSDVLDRIKAETEANNRKFPYRIPRIVTE